VCKDRRQQGIQHVEYENEDTGATVKLYSVNIERFRLWVAAIVGIIAILTAIGGVTRWGVRVEVREAIEDATVSETGCIHREMHIIADDTLDVLQERVTEDMEGFEAELSDVKEGLAELRGQQTAITRQMTENHAEIMRVLHQQ
jgi:hypothetical protein